MDNSSVIKTFNSSQQSLVLQHSDLSLQSISDMVESTAIDVMPRYQRRDRWNLDTNSELIESFLLNIPVPPIYLSEDEYGTYSVIDGKQRVTAIHKFLTNQFRLKNLDRFVELEGCSFDDLPDPIKNALKIRPYLRVVTLLRQSDPELKHEVFLRLNKAGIALNSQEIRNVAFRGDYNDMLLELSELPEFQAALGTSPGTKLFEQMGDIQYVLRFFTLREFYDAFPGNMDKAMDEYMRVSHRLKKSQISKHVDLFKRSFDFCTEIWGAECFRKPNGTSKVLQGFFDIHMVPSSLVDDATLNRVISNRQKFKGKISKLIETDEQFSESLTQFTSNARNVSYRINTVKNVIESF